MSLSRRRLWIIGGGLLLVLLVVAVWLVAQSETAVLAEAPEAARIYEVQAKMPFQILVPAYLPGEFNRTGVEINIDQSGPSSEPMVQLAYHTSQNATVFLRQWVPGDPQKEILANSKPIETKWGTGWLLSRSETMNAVWVDVGPTRVSIYTSDVEILKSEQLLAIAESLGPPTNRQVFTFVVDAPTIREAAPPPPVEIKVNEQVVQELTLVVTPGGYTPLRFAVKKGVPVRLIFRQLGQVGCGNELIFPTGPQNTASLRLKTEQDQQVLEFTPQAEGEYQFHCSHNMYRGIMTVRP